MRNSNFYPDRAFLILRTFVLVGVAALLAETAWAIDPGWLMSQYIRDQWGVDQGFPRGQVHAITQTPDGYLWIGTESGLIRFDGLHFLVVRDPTNSFQIQAILGLTADHDGNLWIRLRAEGTQSLLRYRDGVFTNPEANFVWSNNRITATALDPQGHLIASHTQLGEMVYQNSKFALMGSAGGLPRSPVLSLAQTGNGDVWVGTRDSGVYRIVHGQSAATQTGLPDLKVNCLLGDGTQHLWAGTDDGVVLWNGTEFASAGIPQALNHFQTLAMAHDRNGNLWIGTVSRGLLRLNAQGLATLSPNDNAPVEAVTAVFEDREGNIWTGGASGIQRLRDSAFVSYPPPVVTKAAASGAISGASGAIYVDAKNRTWFAPLNGGLYWLENGEPHRFTGAAIGSDIIYSIAGGDDELWLGRQRGGLTHVSFHGDSLASQTFTTKNGLAQDTIFAVQRNRDGTVWAGTISGGVSRYKDGRFTTYTTADGLASNTVFAVLETAERTMWFATPKGLSSLSGHGWQTFTDRHGLPSANVNCLFQDASGVMWVGTTAGLAFFRAGRFQAVSKGPDGLRDQILGIAQDRSGALWLATATHVLRVNRNSLLRGAASAADVREYGLTDGLHGTEGIKRQHSVIGDSMGRIWFSLNTGLAVVDPSRDAHSSAPILAQIQSISANGEAVGLRGQVVRIPAGRQRIAIHYAGLGLSVPERVRFRYALDGDNPQWSEPVEDREKDFTHLDPGPYRFRVIASTVNGDWTNSPEAAISFEVERAFWQTSWFRLVIIVAFGSLIVALYQFRLRRMAGQLNMRFEERLAERSSIAKELHDTLLQGLLSASMQLHVATDSLGDESPTKPRLRRVLELMGQVVEEGRNAIRGLRSASSAALNLEQSLSRIREEFPSQSDAPAADFHVTVTGHPRPLHPLLRDESYRIGREAVVNALRHSRATRIDTEVEYSSRHLRLVVSDNGCGIDPEVLESGREGHWGLSGMRERAEKIGGQVHVRSSAVAGTEVEFTVPGHLAYLHPPGGGNWRRFRMRLRR